MSVMKIKFIFRVNFGDGINIIPLSLISNRLRNNDFS